jgi:hypothetical protein
MCSHSQDDDGFSISIDVIDMVDGICRICPEDASSLSMI